ncbi:uncharacterized protein LOC113780566 [Coffea eugenioides]|uniref:uncharacterized protein LOC113780566 n=1 Tax=Coffea eugenioides TaxID=49369 RepID=UPI000F60B329|nr:uncharacterized protein LOC113780566 [Coffea eugenioides]
MNNEHTNCSHVWKNKNISAKWLANKYMERFRCNVEMPPRLLRQIVDEDFKAEISKWVAYNAMAIAKKEIQGNAKKQYKDIWRYCAEIKRTHPNTTMEVMFTPFRQPGCNPKFMRLYCCLGPLKQGFLDGCRSIIGVDGCHIKAEYRGQLLTAIGVDPNNGWWPIAWTVVEREATEQWKWFFELLKNDLQIENGYSYTFVSDQQKGLDRALSEVLPNSEHRYCCSISSTTEGLFKKAATDLKKFDKEAYEWVKKAPHPSHWSIHRNNGDPYKEVYDCYNRDLFLKIYKNVLYPINGQVMWPETDGVDLDPPERIVQPGRPKKARRKDPTETQKTGNRLRRRIVIHCRKCGVAGHNAAGYKVQQQDMNQQQNQQN